MHSLSQDLQHEISAKYPASKLVRLSDLEEYDRKLFRKDHGNSCPGLVNVDFYGDQKETLALVLTTGEGANQKAELIVARKLGQSWQTALLDTAGLSVPVVWRQKPGTYKDIENGKTIRATKPVIVFCGYGGWAIVYAWTGKGVDKVWLAD
ncbi:MAG: hypothetical protein DMG32_16025 [Acidobacteria bacterium]|nr:MAG: hypothetical protein DMG32_16025 [Acidobacteriota bacterium]